MSERPVNLLENLTFSQVEQLVEGTTPLYRNAMRAEFEALHSKMDALHTEVTRLKGKSVTWGALAGLLVSMLSFVGEFWSKKS